MARWLRWASEGTGKDYGRQERIKGGQERIKGRQERIKGGQERIKGGQEKFKVGGKGLMCEEVSVKHSRQSV